MVRSVIILFQFLARRRAATKPGKSDRPTPRGSENDFTKPRAAYSRSLLVSTPPTANPEAPLTRPFGQAESY